MKKIMLFFICAFGSIYGANGVKQPYMDELKLVLRDREFAKHCATKLLDTPMKKELSEQEKQKFMKENERLRRSVEKGFLDALEELAQNIVCTKAHIDSPMRDDELLGKLFFNLHAKLGYFIARVQSEMTQVASPFCQAMFRGLDQKEYESTLSVMYQLRGAFLFTNISTLSDVKKSIEQHIRMLDAIRAEFTADNARYFQSILGQYVLVLKSYNEQIVIPNIETKAGWLNKIYDAVFGGKMQAAVEVNMQGALLGATIAGLFIMCTTTTVLDWTRDMVQQAIRSRSYPRFIFANLGASAIILTYAAAIPMTLFGTYYFLAQSE